MLESLTNGSLFTSIRFIKTKKKDIPILLIFLTISLIALHREKRVFISWAWINHSVWIKLNSPCIVIKSSSSKKLNLIQRWFFATGNFEIIFKPRLKLCYTSGEKCFKTLTKALINDKKLLRTLADHGLLKSLWSKSLTRRDKG